MKTLIVAFSVAVIATGCSSEPGPPTANDEKPQVESKVRRGDALNPKPIAETAPAITPPVPAELPVPEPVPALPVVLSTKTQPANLPDAGISEEEARRQTAAAIEAEEKAREQKANEDRKARLEKDRLEQKRLAEEAKAAEAAKADRDRQTVPQDGSPGVINQGVVAVSGRPEKHRVIQKSMPYDPTRDDLKTCARYTRRNMYWKTMDSKVCPKLDAKCEQYLVLECPTGEDAKDGTYLARSSVAYSGNDDAVENNFRACVGFSVIPLNPVDRNRLLLRADPGKLKKR